VYEVYTLREAPPTEKCRMTLAGRGRKFEVTVYTTGSDGSMDGLGG